MICNQCGAENKEDAKFCSGCGKAIGKVTDTQVKKEVPAKEEPAKVGDAKTAKVKKRKSTVTEIVFGIFGTLVIMAIFVAIFVYMFHEPTPPKKNTNVQLSNRSAQKPTKQAESGLTEEVLSARFKKAIHPYWDNWEKAIFGRHTSKEALDSVLDIAKAGYPAAQHYIGLNYLTGNNRDIQKGISWLEKASDNGHLRATINLAELYHYGRFYPYEYYGSYPITLPIINADKAKLYYKRAAELGSLSGKIFLALDNDPTWEDATHVLKERIFSCTKLDDAIKILSNRDNKIPPSKKLDCFHSPVKNGLAIKIIEVRKIDYFKYIHWQTKGNITAWATSAFMSNEELALLTPSKLEKPTKLVKSGLTDKTAKEGNTLADLASGCMVKNANGQRVKFYKTKIPQGVTLDGEDICRIAKEIKDRNYENSKETIKEMACDTAEEAAKRFGNGNYDLAINRVAAMLRTDPNIKGAKFVLRALKICRTKEARDKYTAAIVVTAHIYSVGSFKHQGKECQGYLVELSILKYRTYDLKGTANCTDFNSGHPLRDYVRGMPNTPAPGDYIVSKYKYNGDTPRSFIFRGKVYPYHK